MSCIFVQLSPHLIRSGVITVTVATVDVIDHTEWNYTEGLL
jgi:hypothetical protein